MEANFSSHSTSAAGSSSSNSFRGTGGPSKISDMLIRHVEEVLFAITDNGFCSDMLPNRVKLSDIVQPLTSDFSKIFDGISEGAKVISDQMSASSKLSGEAVKIASDVVKALGNFHFASAALLAIATVLERVEKISANDRDCLDLMKAMLDLAKSIKQLTDINLHSTQRALSEKMTEAVHVIYVGAIICRSFLISKHVWKFILTTKVRDELVRLWRKVDSIKLDLVLQMQIMVMYSLSSQNSFSQLPFSLHEGLRGLTEESRSVQIMEVTEEDGMEERHQLELGAPVQNLLLPESGCVADEKEVPTLFRRISKLLKRITPKRDQTGARTILGMKLGTTYFGWNKRNTDTPHEPDVELDECFAQRPRSYSYAELAAATGNFREPLGHGGFGTVYRGILAGTNETLAVKRISHCSKQGKKEYVSEINIMSQVRHRNLVQLLGWCHKKDDLLLVYKFVPKGSLDKYLFAEHSGTTRLSWKRRYSIACDVASAMVYLHEDWEQCVVHRDIKSSNVLLDSNFTAKLSDFGLARLMERDHEATYTTGVAGTMGYMAPEIMITGKATPQSDVFSFGAVALEIACGKRPLDISLTEHSCRVVQWVWDLFGQGKILEAADKKLDGDFKGEEMERLMAVGLLCSHPDPKARPAMRHVLRILKFEAELPYVPLNFPVAVYNDPFCPVDSSTVTELTLNSSAASISSS